jgi:hypothetical protein
VRTRRTQAWQFGVMVHQELQWASEVLLPTKRSVVMFAAMPIGVISTYL